MNGEPSHWEKSPRGPTFSSVTFFPPHHSLLCDGEPVHFPGCFLTYDHWLFLWTGARGVGVFSGAENSAADADVGGANLDLETFQMDNELIKSNFAVK